MDVKKYLDAKNAISELNDEFYKMSPQDRLDFAKKVNEIKFVNIQKKKLNTNIDENDFGVHKSHCCIRHGCKYGVHDCPVVLGIIKQTYVCEDCTDIDMF